MNARPPARSGFTLIEMLAATAILAVLAGSLYASLDIAFKARKSALSAVETERKLGMAVDFMNADLQSAMVPNGVLAGAFDGNSNQGMFGSASADLSFYAAAADIEPAAGVGDIKKIEYVCEPSTDGNGMILERLVTTNLLAAQVPEPRRETICRGVRTFQMRYFDGTTWLDMWSSADQGNVLPVAVEVTIELGGYPADAARKCTRVLMVPCGQAVDANALSGGAQ